ncbi:uncharacterized protein [Dermacentor andersoni]|uniref:uncharacterized protein n=1 Tax=Dermacentor andersoni TaxID=34620 RepID=UPI002155D462|nr:uncharacterized protein LOC126523087 [Dermacentor andersoni]
MKAFIVVCLLSAAALTSGRRAGRLGSDIDTRGRIRGHLRSGIERIGPNGHPGVSASIGGELGATVGGRAGVGVSSYGYGGPEWGPQWGPGFGGYPNGGYGAYGPYDGYGGYDAGFGSPYDGGYYGAKQGYGYYSGYGSHGGYYPFPAYPGGYPRGRARAPARAVHS